MPSDAETISYWLERDTTSSHADEYALYRRVNARPPRLVARGFDLQRADRRDLSVLQDRHARQSGPDPAGARCRSFTRRAIHGAQTDTGKSALTDSIKQVHVQLTSVYQNPRTPKALDAAHADS